MPLMSKKKWRRKKIGYGEQIFGIYVLRIIHKLKKCTKMSSTHFLLK